MLHAVVSPTKIALMIFLSMAPARAGLLFNIFESGPNVVMDVTGTVNLNGLTSIGPSGFSNRFSSDPLWTFFVEDGLNLGDSYQVPATFTQFGSAPTSFFLQNPALILAQPSASPGSTIRQAFSLCPTVMLRAPCWTYRSPSPTPLSQTWESP